MANQEWYIIDDADLLDTPALVVYPDRVKQNIATLKSMINDPGRLRPHVKTYKNREVTLLMLEAGISKFKCATIAEAEMLGICKAPDVLLAYQPVGPKLKRFIELIGAYPGSVFSCLVDNATAAGEISAEALKNNINIPVFIDLNVGQNRTGIIPEKAFELYQYINSLPGVSIKGLHAYDGHIHAADLETRIKESDAGFERVEQLEQQIMEHGFAEPVVVAGGSPTFPLHAERAVIECSPGTFVYWDKGYESAFAEQPFLPAAMIVSRIISLPAENLICLDMGHKSVAPENVLGRRVWFVNAPDLVMVSQSEEHLVADAGAGHNYKVGDVLYGMPYHICPTVAQYERVMTVEGGKMTGEWKNIARDRRINI